MATSASGLQVSSALSAFASGYTNGNFIADQVCPVILHDGIKGTFHYGSRLDSASNYEDVTSDTSEPSAIDYSDGTTAFVAIARSLMGWVPYSKIDNADDPLKPKEQHVAKIMLKLALAEEVRVAGILNATGSYATANTSAAAALWSDEASGNPVRDIQLMIRSIAPGMDGNSKTIMVLSLAVAQALSRHPSILSLRAGGGNTAGVVKMSEVASMFDGLDEIFVSDAEYLTSNRGQATTTYSKVWSATQAVMVRVPKVEPKGVNDQAMFAARFRWSSASQVPLQVIEWDDPKRGPGKGSVGVKASHWTSVPTVIQSDMGYCLTTVL